MENRRLTNRSNGSNSNRYPFIGGSTLRVIPNGIKKRFVLNQVTDIVRHILFTYRLSLNFLSNHPPIRAKFIEFSIENLFDIEFEERKEIALRGTFKVPDENPLDIARLSEVRAGGEGVVAWRLKRARVAATFPRISPK